jgi:hypothetical protein
MKYVAMTIAKLMTAKIMYVLCPIVANAMGVIKTTTKLKIQLPAVLTPFPAARMDSGVISAGYSHVIPSQPTEKC